MLYGTGMVMNESKACILGTIPMTITFHGVRHDFTLQAGNGILNI